jgi:hypothetical protein
MAGRSVDNAKFDVENIKIQTMETLTFYKRGKI